MLRMHGKQPLLAGANSKLGSLIGSGALPAQVITSLHLEADPDHLIILATTSHEQKEGSAQELWLVLPRKKAYFTGTGLHFLGKLASARVSLYACLQSLQASLVYGFWRGWPSGWMERASQTAH